MVNVGCCPEQRGFPVGKFLLIITLVVAGIIWLATDHMIEKHGDQLTWVIRQACQTDPQWKGTDDWGRIATIGRYTHNGEPKLGICLEDPPLDGDELDPVTAYPRSGTLESIIEYLKGGGYK